MPKKNKKSASEEALRQKRKRKNQRKADKERLLRENEAMKVRRRNFWLRCRENAKALGISFEEYKKRFAPKFQSDYRGNRFGGIGGKGLN